MNKKEFVNELVNEIGGTKKDAEKYLNKILFLIVDKVSQGDRVNFIGFGAFEAKERKARKGNNPQTGEVINIPKKTVPAFTPGTLFKETVDGEAVIEKAKRQLVD